MSFGYGKLLGGALQHLPLANSREMVGSFCSRSGWMNATYGTAPEGTDCDSLDARVYDEAVRYRRRGVRNTSMASTVRMLEPWNWRSPPGQMGLGERIAAGDRAQWWLGSRPSDVRAHGEET